MFVRITARMEKFIHRDYEAPNKDIALKQFLTDIESLRKQGFVIIDVCTEDLQDWSEDLSSEPENVPSTKD